MAAAQTPNISATALLDIFSSLDTDADGTLTTIDLISVEQTRFFEADTGKDGFIDTAELSRYWSNSPTSPYSPDQAGVYILTFDKDRDNRLDMIEFINPPRQARIIAAMESDGRPGITLTEFRIFLQK